MNSVKQTIDYTMASAAVTTPLWLEQLHTWGGAAMLIGGLVLLAIRIGLAIREWRTKKP